MLATDAAEPALCRHNGQSARADRLRQDVRGAMGMTDGVVGQGDDIEPLQ